MKLCKLLTISLFFVTSAFAITPQESKYSGHCAYGLSMGKQVMTDCSVTYTDTTTNDKYCFLNEENKKLFLKDSVINIAKADGEYTKIGAMNKASTAMADAQKQMNESMNQANAQINAHKNTMGTAPAGH